MSISDHIPAIKQRCWYHYGKGTNSSLSDYDDVSTQEAKKVYDSWIAGNMIPAQRPGRTDIVLDAKNETVLASVGVEQLRGSTYLLFDYAALRHYPSVELGPMATCDSQKEGKSVIIRPIHVRLLPYTIQIICAESDKKKIKPIFSSRVGAVDIISTDSRIVDASGDKFHILAPPLCDIWPSISFVVNDKLDAGVVIKISCPAKTVSQQGRVLKAMKSAMNMSESCEGRLYRAATVADIISRSKDYGLYVVFS